MVAPFDLRMIVIRTASKETERESEMTWFWDKIVKTKLDTSNPLEEYLTRVDVSDLQAVTDVAVLPTNEA